MAKQLANAREKIERAQQHIEDKRVASRQAIQRLEKEYENMAIERRDNDKYNEELRAEADAIERKVSRDFASSRARNANGVANPFPSLLHRWPIISNTTKRCSANYSPNTGHFAIEHVSRRAFNENFHQVAESMSVHTL